MTWSSMSSPWLYRFLGECSRQLSDQTGKRHIERRIQIAGLWTRVVLEHFHGDGRIVGDDHTGLNHSQQARDALGFAERAGGVNHGIRIVAKPRSMDGGASQTEFRSNASVNEFLAAG